MHPFEYFKTLLFAFKVSPAFVSILKLPCHFDSISKAYGHQTSARNGHTNIFHFQFLEIGYVSTEKRHGEFNLINEKIVVFHSGAKFGKQKMVLCRNDRQKTPERKELIRTLAGAKQKLNEKNEFKHLLDTMTE